MSDYRSDRGIPLVWMSESAPTVPTITVEAWCKWYKLFVVHLGGQVTPLLYHDLDDHARQGEVAYSDHVPSPKAVSRFAEARGMQIDPLALELMVGRWVMEVIDTFDPN